MADLPTLSAAVRRSLLVDPPPRRVHVVNASPSSADSQSAGFSPRPPSSTWSTQVRRSLSSSTVPQEFNASPPSPASTECTGASTRGRTITATRPTRRATTTTSPPTQASVTKLRHEGEEKEADAKGQGDGCPQAEGAQEQESERGQEVDLWWRRELRELPRGVLLLRGGLGPGGRVGDPDADQGRRGGDDAHGHATLREDEARSEGEGQGLPEEEEV